MKHYFVDAFVFWRKRVNASRYIIRGSTDVLIISYIPAENVIVDEWCSFTNRVSRIAYKNNILNWRELQKWVITEYTVASQKKFSFIFFCIRAVEEKFFIYVHGGQRKVKKIPVFLKKTTWHESLMKDYLSVHEKFDQSWTFTVRRLLLLIANLIGKFIYYSTYSMKSKGKKRRKIRRVSFGKSSIRSKCWKNTLRKQTVLEGDMKTKSCPIY